MNILLCESQYRTRSWVKALKKNKNLFILSVLTEEYKLFLDIGIPKNKICNLNHKNLNLEQKISKIKNFLNYFEKNYSLNINKYILMDRTLRTKKDNVILQYVYNIITREIDFIKKNKIQLIFMEATWFHELILCKIAEKLKIPVLVPVRDKIISNKFYFFYGENRENFFKRPKRTARFNETNSQHKTPYYDYLSKRNKITFNKIIIFFRLLRLSILDFNNPFIQAPFHEQVSVKILSIFRQIIFKFYLNFYHPRIDEKFILIPLHVQPEAGIDVIGEKFSNQLEFIRQIARTTPVNFKIYVKEHPHDFGRRRLNFYNSLKEIPLVKLINPNFSNKTLIQNAELIISVAGTTSLEASIIGKKAVTAAKSQFNKIMIKPKFDPFNQEVNELVNSPIKPNLYKNKNYLRSLQRNLFEGKIMDSKVDRSVMDNENIQKLRKAFNEVINFYKHNK
ncbi:hypothetical protein OA253_01955 [Alphaproteobacteria bacterium]|nr:hypothetical protein [Alphaproteobacteria bacterium]